MRKGLAVIFTLIVASAQFGRIISYLHCKWETLIVTSGKPSCDCEKVFPPAKSGDHDFTATVNIKIITIEEYPIPSHLYLKEINLYKFSDRNQISLTDPILTGTPREILRPPQI
ncbi:MAG: hypothetical protein C5B52_01815 [Bacteroidetes bacterium]|nr:MAG: hypothetical protein C5B52_01815 [Bacteroidota bacterium]